MGGLSAEAKDFPLCLWNILHHKDKDCGVPDKQSHHPHLHSSPGPSSLTCPLPPSHPPPLYTLPPPACSEMKEPITPASTPTSELSCLLVPSHQQSLPALPKWSQKRVANWGKIASILPRPEHCKRGSPKLSKDFHTEASYHQRELRGYLSPSPVVSSLTFRSRC